MVGLDLFNGKVKFDNLGFSVKTVDFSQTVTACDLKVGRCSQLIIPPAFMPRGI